MATSNEVRYLNPPAVETQKKKQMTERENKLRELLQRIELLPKSLQLAIQGELASLNND